MPVKKRKVRTPGCWLVQEWRQAWKWFSVQIMVIIAGAQGVLIFAPTVKEFIPPTIWHAGMTALAILAIIGRLINQGGNSGKN